MLCVFSRTSVKRKKAITKSKETHRFKFLRHFHKNKTFPLFNLLIKLMDLGLICRV